MQWAQAHSPQGLCRCSAASAGELCWSPAAVPWVRPNWEQCRTPGDKWLSSRHWGQVTESPVHGCGGGIDRSGRGTGQAPGWACPAGCPAPAQTPSPVCASRSVGRARWQTRRGRLSRGPASPCSPWKRRRPAQDAEESHGPGRPCLDSPGNSGAGGAQSARGGARPANGEAGGRAGRAGARRAGHAPRRHLDVWGTKALRPPPAPAQHQVMGAPRSPRRRSCPGGGRRWGNSCHSARSQIGAWPGEVGMGGCPQGMLGDGLGALPGSAAREGDAGLEPPRGCGCGRGGDSGDSGDSVRGASPAARRFLRSPRGLRCGGCRAGLGAGGAAVPLPELLSPGLVLASRCYSAVLGIGRRCLSVLPGWWVCCCCCCSDGCLVRSVIVLNEKRVLRDALHKWMWCSRVPFFSVNWKFWVMPY